MSDYNGPLVGYTGHEMAFEIGKAVLDMLEKNGMEIVWKKPDGSNNR